MVSVQLRPNTFAPGDGSRTITVHDQSAPDVPDDNSVEHALPDGTLRLRGGPRSRPRVAWDERVVDNENCGRKKSKICCIYHKPREFDESESDGSSSESDSDVSDDGRARPYHNSNDYHHHHRRPSVHDNDASAADGGNGLRNGDVKDSQVESSHESNAYEVQPSHPKKSKGCADS